MDVIQRSKNLGLFKIVTTGIGGQMHFKGMVLFALNFEDSIIQKQKYGDLRVH